MLIARHLGTPNSSFPLASQDATRCVIQYYIDQWSAEKISFICNNQVYIVFLFSFQAQFKLCYEAVASVLRSFNEYSNFTDLE